MICPSCGTQNADTNRFCQKCGYKLRDTPVSNGPFTTYQARKLQDPFSQISLICGLTGIFGGALSILGWLIPWFSLGGLANSLLNLLGIGSKFNFLNIGSGFGSGLQMSLFSLLGSFAAFSSERGAFLGVLGLMIFGVLIAIPILGIQNVRSGIGAFDLRNAKSRDSTTISTLDQHLRSMRTNSKVILIIMVIVFVTFTFIPFASSILGSGFYITALGSVCSYLGVFFNQSKLTSLLIVEQ